jgi:glycosyltransferase involved in cell wall biosynthesis
VRIGLHAEQLLYRSPGGIGRYTAQLISGLCALPGDSVITFVARHGRGEVVAAYRDAGLDDVVGSEAVIGRLPRPVLYEGWMAGRGWPPPRHLGPLDVIHAPSVAVPPRSATPLVVTVHDAAPELFPEAFPAAGRRFHRRAMKAVAGRADLVIAVSQAAADDVVRHSRITEDRIRVVPNGVANVDVPDDEVGQVLRRAGLHDRRYVLWVGSLEPRKGVGTLVAAMAELRRRQPDSPVVTVLAGYAGWLGDGLISPVDRAALGPSLIELGRVGERELWCLYRGAAAFAFPSVYEGFGLPVLEAMSQGVPVVASDIAALRELTGGAACLVDPRRTEAWADAIAAVLDSGAEARRLGQAGRERARAFPVEAMVEATRRVYVEAVAR